MNEWGAFGAVVVSMLVYPWVMLWVWEKLRGRE